MTDQRATEGVRLGDEEREARETLEVAIVDAAWPNRGAAAWEHAERVVNAVVAAGWVSPARLRALTGEGQRAARAEALREAADAMPTIAPLGKPPVGVGLTVLAGFRDLSAQEARAWLRDRADRVASGGGQGEEGT